MSVAKHLPLSYLPFMRVSLLMLILGVLIGYAAHSFVAERVERLMVVALTEEAVKKPAAREKVSAPSGPITYMPVEKVLTMLKRRYDKAVVVVLADESYDDQHKLTIVKVIEVWKGPERLVGETMNQPLQAPMSYLHDKGTVRVLKFIHMTPHLNSSGTVTFREGMLGINPTITVEMLRESLTNQAIKTKGGR